jgi:hypothetical protein
MLSVAESVKTVKLNDLAFVQFVFVSTCIGQKRAKWPRKTLKKIQEYQKHRKR